MQESVNIAAEWTNNNDMNINSDKSKEMSYVDILSQINLSTLKERRDYLCKKYFINIQARSHKGNCLLPEKNAC